jgi:hypothetical protein
MAVLSVSDASALVLRCILQFHSLSKPVGQNSQASHSRPQRPVTATRRIGVSKTRNQEPRAVNRPETALAALLFSVVIVAPAAAQQAPPAVSEFCSGCFAYLEFPPPQAEATSTLASAHQDTLPPATAAQVIEAPTLSEVASAK